MLVDLEISRGFEVFDVPLDDARRRLIHETIGRQARKAERQKPLVAAPTQDLNDERFADVVPQPLADAHDAR